MERPQNKKSLAPLDQLAEDWRKARRVAASVFRVVRSFMPLRIWRELRFGALLGWNFIAFVAATGLAMLGLQIIFDVQSLTLAEVCFIVTGLLLFGKVIQFAIAGNYTFWERALFAFFLFGVIGVAAVEVFIFLEKKRPKVAIPTVPAAASPNPNPFRDVSKETIGFIMGGNVVPVPRPFLFDKPYLIPLQGILGDPAFNVIALHLKNDRPIADVKMWGDGEGHYEVEVIQNNLALRPEGWDRNFNNDGLEIVDKDRRPILQIYYKSENEIIITGVFRALDRMIFVSETSIQTRRIGSGAPPPLKRMFRYPSDKNRSVLAHDWVAPY